VTSELALEQVARPVELVGECTRPDCLEFAANLRDKIADRRYQVGVSIMDCPNSLLDWRAMHRTARKRADHSSRLGYLFSEVDYSQYDDDMFEINTSAVMRQGRPMSSGYTEFVKHSRLPGYPCASHRTITYGVTISRLKPKLVAYLTLHRCGELGLVSMILGHRDFLCDDIMFLLFAGMVDDQSGHGGILYYNRHDSGQEGLRFHKERLGFSEGSVEWIL
jgi:hypothetical protein